jgi:hypothetical protein
MALWRSLPRLKPPFNRSQRKLFRCRSLTNALERSEW